MDRLFRDWRFALLWVIGISALAAAYFAEDGGHEDLLAKPPPAAPSAAQPAAASPAPSSAPTAPTDEKTPSYGEPVLDTTPFEPSPLEPQDLASAAPTDASSSGPVAP